jgi:hypothetical protein
MIESPEGVDRGRFLYEKFPKVITNFVNDRKSTYFDSSKVYQPLKKRCQLLDDIIDLRFNNDAFIAEVAMPIVRKRWREIGAFTRKYFENDPLVTLTAIPPTPEENAIKRQALITRNFTTTKFREKCLHWLIDSIARYGSCVVFTQYVEGYNQGGYKTIHDSNNVYNPYQRIPTPKTRKNAVSYPVHVLNYFCDPDKNYFNNACYEGFIDTWTLAQLKLCLEDDHYIKSNVLDIVEKCKKGTTDKDWYGGQGLAEARDFSRATVNPTRMWTSLPFEGNEDDPTDYYVEFIDGKIIRIHENELDYYERPIKTGSLLTRPDVWWGNTDLEDVIPHQNTSNWLLNTQIEGTMKLMDRFMLVRRGSLNVSDINNRHQNGGVVYYDGMEDPSRLMYQVQSKDNALGNLDWLSREIKQSVQESSPIVNMQNKYNEGGLNNSTLGAAQMVASIGEILQADMMLNFSYVLEHVGKVSANILTIMQDEEFLLPTKPNTFEPVQKSQVMGDFEEQIQSSMKINDVVEFSKRSNLLTQFLNWAGTQNPAFQGVNLTEMVKDVLKSGLGQFADLDKYYQPPQPQQQLPGPPQGGQPAPGGQPQADASPMLNAGPITGQMGAPAA